MSRGVAIEMWDGERKFLQQMGRKCGQHSLALMLISGIDSQLSGVSLGWFRLRFSFVKTCRTRGTLASLARSGLWRRKQFCEMAPSSRHGCVCIHTGRMCFLCARGSPAPLCTCYCSKIAPFLGRLLCSPQRCSPQPHGHMPPSTVSKPATWADSPLPARLPLPRGPGGGWWLRLNEDFLMSVLRDACLPWAGAAWSLPRYLAAAPLVCSPSTFVLETLLWEGEGGRRGSVAAELPLLSWAAPVVGRHHTAHRGLGQAVTDAFRAFPSLCTSAQRLWLLDAYHWW